VLETDFERCGKRNLLTDLHSMSHGLQVLLWPSERCAVMCLVLVYMIWSISVIVGLRFLLCGT